MRNGGAYGVAGEVSVDFAAIGRVADQHGRTRLTPRVQKAFRWLLKRRRGG